MWFMLALCNLAFAQEAAVKERPQMGVSLQFRSLFVPDGLLDNWALNEDEPDAPQEADAVRPKVKMMTMGIEYSVKPGPTDFLFYLDFLKSRTDAGYWNDPDEEPHDGVYVDATGATGLSFGVSTIYEPVLTNESKPVSLALMAGGGLGVLVRTGDLELWYSGDNIVDEDLVDPACEPDSASYVRKDTCTPDTESATILKALPVIDLTLGLKLNLGPHAAVRLEGGIHDALYWGVAAGGQF